MTPFIHGMTVVAAITCAFGFGYTLNTSQLSVSDVSNTAALNTQAGEGFDPQAFKAAPPQPAKSAELTDAEIKRVVETLKQLQEPEPQERLASTEAIIDPDLTSTKACSPGLPPAFVKGDDNTKLAVLSVYRIAAYSTQSQSGECGCPFENASWENAYAQLQSFQKAKPNVLVSGAGLSARANALSKERAKRCAS